MHHVVIDRWSRLDSLLHSREPRIKLLALLAFLVSVATTPDSAYSAGFGYLLLVVAAAFASRLPVTGLAARAAVVLPFSLMFALVSLLAGDTVRAGSLAAKSFLSAAAVLLVVATTPLERLTRAMESLGIPRLIALVVQFLYRYLFVISEQAQHMSVAAACRAPAGNGASRKLRFRAAAGALGILFARSHARAEAIHRSMLARGFEGQFPVLDSRKPGSADFLFLAATILLCVAIRLGVAHP